MGWKIFGGAAAISAAKPQLWNLFLLHVMLMWFFLLIGGDDYVWLVCFGLVRTLALVLYFGVFLISGLNLCPGLGRG